MVGPLLFQANIVVYLTYVLIVVIDVWLFRTRWGLRTRAVGEHPKAADTVGIKVLGMRYRNVILGGAVAGLGGAYFTIGSVGAFAKNITSGKGFIALAALIFGRWSPRGAVAAALLFGFASALQTMLSINVPVRSRRTSSRCCRTSPRSSRWPGWSAGCGHRRPTASRTSRADRPELADEPWRSSARGRVRGDAARLRAVLGVPGRRRRAGRRRPHGGRAATSRTRRTA